MSMYKTDVDVFAHDFTIQADSSEPPPNMKSEADACRLNRKARALRDIPPPPPPSRRRPLGVGR